MKQGCRKTATGVIASQRLTLPAPGESDMIYRYKYARRCNTATGQGPSYSAQLLQLHHLHVTLNKLQFLLPGVPFLTGGATVLRLPLHSSSLAVCAPIISCEAHAVFCCATSFRFDEETTPPPPHCLLLPLLALCCVALCVEFE